MCQVVNQARELIPSPTCHAAVLTSPGSSYPQFLIVGISRTLVEDVLFVFHFFVQQHLLQKESPKDRGFTLFFPRSPSPRSPYPPPVHSVITFHLHILLPLLFQARGYSSWNLSGYHHRPLDCMQVISFDTPLQKLE